MPNPEKQRRRRKRDRQLVREELLRPSRYLGYDRDQLGVHFMAREAYELAESQFRRAAWLNPFEPAFKLHWALALVALRKTVQAHRIVREVLTQHPANPEALTVWNRYWPEQPLPIPPRHGAKERETS